MKRLSILKYLMIAALLFSFAACDDILSETDPATSVSGEQALSSADGVNAVRAAMYSKLRSSFDYTTEYMIGPSAFADETITRGGATRFQGLNQAIGTSGTAHLTSYGSTYNIILDANLLIGGVEEGVVPAETLNRYRGEALAIRAYAMHHLVRALGYEPGMIPADAIDPNWDLGIIIRTEPTLDLSDADERPRATVQEVYNQILNDLSTAKGLLAGVNSDNTRVTEAFVDGLTARVNLYAGNWGDAASAAQDAITNSGRSLVQTPDGVAGMFFETQGGHPEALFKIVVDPNTEAIGGSNVNSGLAAYTSSQWVSQVPTQRQMELYDEDDFRLGEFVTDDNGDVITDPERDGVRLYEGGWYQPCFNDQQGTVAANCSGGDRNEDGLSTNKWNGDKGNLADDIPIMRISEMYLIRAEALAKDANSPAAGEAALNTLRAARGLTPIADANPGALADIESFEDEILDERSRELIVEGHRFWDLKRLGRDVRFPDGSIKMFYSAYRILGPIGQGNINVNSELVENPGYPAASN
ncbi:MAG: RagB/SusD family nutrient uptake outer membrane protein [Bacteroidetes bacterium]|nr:RagB/SusD family nutrient uptake outer membrane protein [Bacteroidota bacterium]